MDAITAVVVDMLRSSPYDSAIILSGAGTSGRIAFSIARAFNAVLEKHGKPRCIHYLIAGGDAALLKVREHIRTVHLSCSIVKVPIKIDVANGVELACSIILILVHAA